MGIASKDFVQRTGSSSEKRARLLEKLQSLIGRARFLAIREQLPTEISDYDTADEADSLPDSPVEGAKTRIQRSAEANASPLNPNG